MTTVKDLINYLELFPEDMPIVTGNTSAWYSGFVYPVNKDEFKEYLKVERNVRWGDKHQNPNVEGEVLMIYDKQICDH